MPFLWRIFTEIDFGTESGSRGTVFMPFLWRIFTEIDFGTESGSRGTEP